jgi:excisionase family DNA binding protein
MSNRTPFLRVGEIAALLGVSRSRAYELVREHQIPSVTLGGRILVPAASWERWLDAQAVAADSVGDRTARP